MSQPNRIIYDAGEIDLFRLLEDRRLEAQRQNETLHARISSLRDELHEEISSSHKEIMREIRELREDQNKHANEMSERIGHLERWKWIIVGGAGILGILLGGLDTISGFVGK